LDVPKNIDFKEIFGLKFAEILPTCWCINGNGVKITIAYLFVEIILISSE